MTSEQVLNILSAVLIVLCVASILFSIVRFIVLAYRRYKIRTAPVFTERATIYLKHEETDIPYLGRGSSAVHYVTFHTDFGQAVKLYMNPRDFYTLKEGDAGTLTWQGEKFWEFTPESK